MARRLLPLLLAFLLRRAASVRDHVSGLELASITERRAVHGLAVADGGDAASTGAVRIYGSIYLLAPIPVTFVRNSTAQRLISANLARFFEATLGKDVLQVDTSMSLVTDEDDFEPLIMHGDDILELEGYPPEMLVSVKYKVDTANIKSRQVLITTLLFDGKQLADAMLQSVRLARVVGVGTPYSQFLGVVFQPPRPQAFIEDGRAYDAGTQTFARECRVQPSQVGAIISIGENGTLEAEFWVSSNNKKFRKAVIKRTDEATPERIIESMERSVPETLSGTSTPIPASRATSSSTSAATSSPARAATSRPASAATSRPASTATSRPASTATSPRASTATSRPANAATSSPTRATTASLPGTTPPSSRRSSALEVSTHDRWDFSAGSAADPNVYSNLLLKVPQPSVVVGNGLVRSGVLETLEQISGGKVHSMSLLDLESFLKVEFWLAFDDRALKQTFVKAVFTSAGLDLARDICKPIFQKGKAKCGVQEADQQLASDYVNWLY